MTRRSVHTVRHPRGSHILSLLLLSPDVATPEKQQIYSKLSYNPVCKIVRTCKVLKSAPRNNWFLVRISDKNVAIRKKMSRFFVTVPDILNSETSRFKETKRHTFFSFVRNPDIEFYRN